MNNLVPNYLKPLVCKRPVKYRTRFSLRCPLQLPKARTEYKRKSFAYFGPKLFNALPSNLQACTCTSLLVFKKLCKAFHTN